MGGMFKKPKIPKEAAPKVVAAPTEVVDEAKLAETRRKMAQRAAGRGRAGTILSGETLGGG